MENELSIAADGADATSRVRQVLSALQPDELDVSSVSVDLVWSDIDGGVSFDTNGDDPLDEAKTIISNFAERSAESLTVSLQFESGEVDVDPENKSDSDSGSDSEPPESPGRISQSTMEHHVLWSLAQVVEDADRDFVTTDEVHLHLRLDPDETNLNSTASALSRMHRRKALVERERTKKLGIDTTRTYAYRPTDAGRLELERHGRPDSIDEMSGSWRGNADAPSLREESTD